MSKPRILVLAGDEALREGVAASAARLGADVQQAGDAGGGVERLGASRLMPDAILLDMATPSASRFLEALRAEPRLAEVPVLTIGGGTPPPLPANHPALQWTCDVEELSQLLLSLCDGRARRGDVA